MINLKEERKTTGWAARDTSALLSRYTFTLRNTGAEDVLIKIICCGVCHSDYHMIKNELGITNYPMVPGHEVVGKAVEVGSNVSKFKVGDIVGVGPLVGSCNKCYRCEAGAEQYCNKPIWSYSNVYRDGKPTQGGFSGSMVVHQKFVVKIPQGLSPEQAAPLLCAGVTIYSPLSHFELKKSGLRGCIVGLGGVGHMGVLIGKALGHHMTVISSSNKKRDEAMIVLKADEYVISSDTYTIQALGDSLDYIIYTIPTSHPLDEYLSMLKLDGKLILLGLVNTPLHFLSPLLMSGRKKIMGSITGSMKETEEVLELCKEKKMKLMIEVVKIEYINTAMERLAKNDVKYRFVVDMASSKLDGDDDE